MFRIVFGENPNKKYLFIVHNLEKGSGGLEHKSSTTLQVNRWTYKGDAYIGFLSLVAHEYFHLWNVKRIRPAALGPFNYDEENYTHLLWVMEGFTSYYDELLLLRAGFIDMEEYFNKIYGTMKYIESLPGNKLQPVAMSSFDAWIKAYRSNENSHNIGVSYYSKGAVIAALMDIMILSENTGKSLDGFLQHLYKTFYLAEDRGFTSAEFEAELEAYTGMEWTQFLADYVFDTKPLPYEKVLDKVGVYAKASEKTKSDLGLRFLDAEVSRIYTNSPAEQAGINVNDILIAMNDFHIDSDTKWDDLVSEFYGEEVLVVVARDGMLVELKVKLEDFVIPTLEVTEIKPNELTQVWLRTL